MPTYRVQVALQDESGLPRDQYVNTWHVAAPAPLDWNADPGAAPILASFSAFYESLVGYYSPVLAQSSQQTTKVYDLAAPLHSPPLATRLWTFLNNPGANDATTALPGEVAVCLTMHGTPKPGPGNFPQSWRGRVYLGPLNTTVIKPSGPEGGRPTDAFRTAVVAVAKTLDTAVRTSGGQLVIYSRKMQWIFPVASFGCDDAFDIQRSRGNRPTVTGNSAVGHSVPDSTPV